MRIAIVGGGPGGLYLSILLKKLEPALDVTVYERNAPDDTFGFGVVFSDETLAAFEAADPPTYAEITERFARWAEIDVHYRGEVVTSGGHGFSALARVDLLGVLQRRAAALDVDLRFRTEVDGAGLDDDADVVVAADGVNSALRRRHAEHFRPSLDRRRAKYVWFGTDLVFDAFKFFIKETEHGVLQVHGYPYSDTMSTFIVETTPEAWRGLGLDRATEEESLAICEDLFADVLDLGVEAQPHAEVARAALEDLQQQLACDRRERVPARAQQPVAVADVDGRPARERVRDAQVGLRVGVAQRAERLLGEDDAPAERRVRGVALHDGDVVRRALLRQQDRELEPGRAGAKDPDPHASTSASQSSCALSATLGKRISSSHPASA